MENLSSLKNSQRNRQNAYTTTSKISNFIDQDSCLKLQEMGFSQNASEKALFLNDNNIEFAGSWLYEHQNEADLNEPFDPLGNRLKLLKSKNSEKAKNLHEKLLKETENQANALRNYQDESKKRQEKLIVTNKEKEDLMKFEELERKKIVEEMESKSEHNNIEKNKYTKQETVLYYLNSIKLVYSMYPDEIKKCFSLIKIALNNILIHMNDEKYRKLKLTNRNVQERIGNIPMALVVLNNLGFVEEGEYLICKTIDINLFNNIIEYLSGQL